MLKCGSQGLIVWDPLLWGIRASFNVLCVRLLDVVVMITHLSHDDITQIFDLVDFWPPTPTPRYSQIDIFVSKSVLVRFYCWYLFFQVSSTLSKMRGFPWTSTATCTSPMPWGKTAALITAALSPSPEYAPLPRKLPWLLLSRAVGVVWHTCYVSRAGPAVAGVTSG